MRWYSRGTRYCSTLRRCAYCIWRSRWLGIAADDRLLMETAMKLRSLGLSIVSVLVLPGTVAAQVDNRIYYGSRAGMHLTTVSKQGIGTANAVILLKHTPEDAKAYC